MARSRKSSSSKSGGSTFFGILVGLIVGVAAAVAVALFVTKVPMPFVDKASRDPAKTLLPDVRDAPDPNIGLYGRNGAAGVPPNGPVDTTLAPLPPNAPLTVPGTQAPRASEPDNLGALIASLGSGGAAPANRPDAAPARSAAPSRATAPAPPVKSGTPAAPATALSTYFLQAGAFRSESDAEAVKARILMLGMPAQVQKAQVGGGTINRVRVGPFKGLDDMNRSRARLGAEKIESSVVRQ